MSRKNVYVCENCCTEVDAKSRSLNSWATLNSTLSTPLSVAGISFDSDKEDKDFCSYQCIVDFCNKTIIATSPVDPQATRDKNKFYLELQKDIAALAYRIILDNASPTVSAARHPQNWSAEDVCFRFNSFAIREGEEGGMLSELNRQFAKWLTEQIHILGVKNPLVDIKNLFAWVYPLVENKFTAYLTVRLAIPREQP